MSKLIEIRDVPDDVHRILKARAAQSGMSLSAFLRAELTLIASRPTPDEVLERLRRRPRATVPDDMRPAVLIRKMRGPLS